MKKSLAFSSLMLAFIFLIASCKSDIDYVYYTAEEKKILDQNLNLPDLPHDYRVDFPEHLSSQGLFPRPVEDEKATLGRVLFYDKKLSKTQTVACASCHQQSIGFSDDKALSLGVRDQAGDRNAIALGSVSNFSAYYGTDLNGPSAIRFLWDNRAGTAAEQAKSAITNPKEMDMHMNEVVEMAKQQPYYKVLFNKAYGSKQQPNVEITESRLLEAIASFVDAMGSYSSKFDQEARKQYINGSFGIEPVKNDFPGFTPQENAGKKIYMNSCASCHSAVAGRPNLFYANNGLDAQTGADRGVGAVPEFANQPGVDGAFKVPTLRNVALSAPYMHDGRFKTLQEVIEHYSTGIKSHPNLHSNLPKGGFNFSATQKADLLAFLQTFTDNKFTTDERFANPFK